MLSIAIPPSKSISHRALFCAACATGESSILNPLDCDDTQATVDVLTGLGIQIEKHGGRWTICGGTFHQPEAELYCSESGTTWRFLTALAAALKIPARITGEASLLRRPIAPLREALRNLGGDIRLEGGVSSQFLSALLLAAPLAKTPTRIELISPLVSKPYAVLTIAVQKEFGIHIEADENFSNFKIQPQACQPAEIKIEGDWSSAAFWIAAGLLVEDVALEGLNPASLQADRQILDIVKEMGGEFFWEGKKLVVKKSELPGVRWDFSDTPDLYPVASVLKKFARGKCAFTGLERLRFKESDRRLGLEEAAKSRDHRIVMAAAISALATGKKVVFQYPECVAKSYPGFWKDYERFAG